MKLRENFKKVIIEIFIKKRLPQCNLRLYQAGAPYLSYSLNTIFVHKINSANAAIEHMGSINQAFYEILESTDDLVQNGDDILKFTSHLQSILNKLDATDHLQIRS